MMFQTSLPGRNDQLQISTKDHLVIIKEVFQTTLKIITVFYALKGFKILVISLKL